ncbi:MAG: hypothetical protein K0Q57_1224 [Gammaproteobacteria bacterium]|jgi:hypothetical protein|nr:hypothetical protein [Gammaproteobacteria bacterium]
MDRNTRKKISVISLMLILIAASTSFGVFGEREFNPEDNLLGILLITLSGLTGISAVAAGVWATSLFLGRSTMLALGQQDHEIEMQDVHEAYESPRDKSSFFSNRLLLPIKGIFSTHDIGRPVDANKQPYENDFLDEVATVVAADFNRRALG